MPPRTGTRSSRRASPSGSSRPWPAPDTASRRSRREPLTSREEEVLATVAQGWTNHEIAEHLYISISISTVKTHLASLMRKLDARNRVEMAMWAYETGRVRK